MDYKTCTQCGKTLPATAEYFYRSKGGLFGLHSWCKECRAEYYRKYYQNTQEKRLEQAKEYRQNNREKRAKYMQEYQQRNKKRLLERKRQWLKANPGKKGEYDRKYYQNNREKVWERNREWRENNPEKLREYRREYYREYFRNNPEKAGAYSRNYRSRLLGAEGFHTATDIMKQYNLQQGRCYYCNCELNYEFDVDHYIPLSKGGTNWPDNLVIACATCNRSKNDKLPEEYLSGEGQ